MDDQPMTPDERASAMLAAVQSLQEQSERQAGEETDSFRVRPEESEWVPGRPNGDQWGQLPGLTVNRPSRQTPQP